MCGRFEDRSLAAIVVAAISTQLARSDLPAWAAREGSCRSMAGTVAAPVIFGSVVVSFVVRIVVNLSASVRLLMFGA
jgi:hypothetical protein